MSAVVNAVALKTNAATRAAAADVATFMLCVAELAAVVAAFIFMELRQPRFELRLYKISNLAACAAT